MNPEEKNVFNKVKRALREVQPNKRYNGLVEHWMCGHCHHAALAIQIILGGAKKGYRLETTFDADNIQHYWVVSPSGEIIDPTAEQYTDLNRDLPYNRSSGMKASYRRPKQTTSIISIVEQDYCQIVKD